LLKDFNANQVIVNVKEKIEEIQNILPPGIKIKPFVDRSEFISSTTSTIKENLILGALIVIFVLVFLLGSFRGGIIVASTIPLAVLFAFLLMKITGTWINLMSLGAIDFGILVDGAVIIVEGTLAYLSGKLLIPENISPSKDNITTLAAGNMMSSAFFGQFIILIVFIPILMLQGVEGKMFKPMAYTFAFAMLGVIMLCLTYVPALTALWIRHDNKKTIGEKWMEKIENSYEKFLLRLFGYRKIIYAFSFIFMASGIFLFFRSGGEFLPRLDEGDMAMHILLKPGSSVSESVKIATEVERLLKKNFPEVKQMVSRFGVSEIPTDPMPIEMGDCIITLKPKNEWTSASTKEELIEKMKQTLSIIPGVNFIFTQPIEMRFNELLSGVREDLAIKIFGDDWNTLDSIARQIAQIIKDIPGVADLKTEAISGHPQINIKILRHKLALYGLSVEDVQQTIQAIVAGIEAGQILENNKRFDLMLRFDSASSQSVESIGNIPLTTPQGHKIMLKQIADIGFVNGALQISRENTHRRSYVGVNVRNRDLASVVEDIQNKLEKKLLLPPGYRIAFGGAYENYERALSTFAWLVPIVLLTIGLLIYFAIESFRQTLLIYTAVPFAFTGGIWAIYLRDINFSISAGVGFIVLFGVAVLNGLVLFNVWNELKKNEISMKKLSVQGAKIRIRPILLTALTDILGFLPMAFSQSAGAEVQRPLATVVIGGMFTSTTLILILLPLLFYDTYSAKKTLKS
jgi:cobalt-zinc-cadmium resistance protein CzcA